VTSLAKASVEAAAVVVIRARFFFFPLAVVLVVVVVGAAVSVIFVIVDVDASATLEDSGVGAENNRRGPPTERLRTGEVPSARACKHLWQVGASMAKRRSWSNMIDNNDWDTSASPSFDLAAETAAVAEAG
jgi:hypothetical protein